MNNQPAYTEEEVAVLKRALRKILRLSVTFVPVGHTQFVIVEAIKMAAKEALDEV